MTRILLLGSFLLLATLSTQGQKLDFSSVPQFKTVWTAEIGLPPVGSKTNGHSLLVWREDFCGYPSMDLLTMDAITRGTFSFVTTPRLDTHSVWHWPDVVSRWNLIEFHYDAHEPAEYVDGRGTVWACSQGISPFPLIAIDTLSSPFSSPWDLEWTGATHVDFNGDMFQDLMFVESGWRLPSRLIVVPGGDSHPAYDDRSIVFTSPQNHIENFAFAWFKGFDGVWYLLQNEHDEDFSGYDGKTRTFPVRLTLYRVDFVQQAGAWSASFTELDSLVRTTQVSGDVVDTRYARVAVLADSVARTHHIFLDHVQYHIVDGLLEEGATFNSAYRFQSAKNLGASLGTNRSVVGLVVGGSYLTDKQSRVMLVYMDRPDAPFATLANLNTLSTRNSLHYAVINDLTGDGKPEIFYTSENHQGMLTLYLASSDSNALGLENVVVESPTDMQIVGEQLHVRVYESQTVDVNVANLSGKLSPVISGVLLTSGLNVIDLSPHLRSLTPGYYNVVVRVGATVKYVSILR